MMTCEQKYKEAVSVLHALLLMLSLVSCRGAIKSQY